VPYGATIPGATILSRLFDGFLVVPITFRLGEHKDVFVCSCGSVFDTLRHYIGLMPDYVASEEPSAVLQGESKPPRYPHQVLIF
jgi:hypothetical protein